MSPLSNEESDSSPIQEQKNHYTTSMESFIGNFIHSTHENYKNCDDDPYANIFEDDNLDNENIQVQETDNDGNIF